jgi:formylglycine-generating enzyme required for sulfatase activity
MTYIPAGTFRMGDTFAEGEADELPVHNVYVSGFHMDRYEVSKALWDSVYVWATNNSYTFETAGSARGTNHPAHTVDWYDVVKWCNARSEKEGLGPCYHLDDTFSVVYRSGAQDISNSWVNWSTNGYRLPTEAEWEKAARGGSSAHRFPWADDTVTHERANYYSSATYSYDISKTRGYHPAHYTNVPPSTSPVGSFTANGHGLYDVCGNLWEWCWDWHGATYYASSPETDPCGPTSGSDRVLRGGNWQVFAEHIRLTRRGKRDPAIGDPFMGFRCVRR